jgi:hypothetical protein
MIFTPHTLLRNVATTKQDEFGNAVPVPPEWTVVGPCRCDDNYPYLRPRVSVGGVMYRYMYHIVYMGGGVRPEDVVRAVDTATGAVRGEGVVVKASGCNYFNYATIWI